MSGRPDEPCGSITRVAPGTTYGRGVPHLTVEGYPGKIIAIEGTDGVGRSTQIRLLRGWLEVAVTGCSRPSGRPRR
jgi:ABC-type hemin transport system ATPase subunit